MKTIPLGWARELSLVNIVEFAARLNRRHKAAVCATLVCLGLIVLKGGTVRDAVGIALLGTAFSWALGSNSRLVHWSFVVFGSLLLLWAAADGIDWHLQSRAAFIKSWRDIIAGDQETLKSDEAWTLQVVSDPAAERDAQKEVSDQRQLLRDAEHSLRQLEAETTYRRLIETDWDTIVPGLLLFSSGVGLLFGIRPVRQSAGL